MVLCLLQGLITPAAAQSDPKATMEAINYVIRNVRPSSAAEPLAEDLCQKFKKHPEVMGDARTSQLCTRLCGCRCVG